MTETITAILNSVTTIMVLGWAVFVFVALCKTWRD
jgi:hypothetical protein